MMSWFYPLFSMNRHLPWLELGSFPFAARGAFIDLKKSLEF